MANFPFTIIQRNIAAYQDETVDDDFVRKSLFQFRRTQLRAATDLLVSKFVQYDVLNPPDTAVDASKFVQYDVLNPPDTAVDASKAIQYVVLESQPSIKPPPFAFWMRNRIAWQNDIDADEQANSQRILTSRRIPTLTRVDDNITLAGVAVIGHAGTLIAKVDKALTGVQATASIGMVTTETDTSPAISGVAGTSHVGTVKVEIDKALTGVQATGQVGTFTVQADASPSITGVQGTAQVGIISAQVGGHPLTGVGATASVTGPTVKIEIIAGTPQFLLPYTGVHAIASVGSFGFSSDFVLGSVSATAHVGTIHVLNGINGVQANTGIGHLGSQAGHWNTPGVQAVAQVGTTLVHVGPNETVVTFSGVAATARTGSMSFAQGVEVMGVQGNAQVGALQTLIYQLGLTISSLQCETVPTQNTDALVSLRWSDNKGQTYSNPVMQSMGGTGQYTTNVQWRRLGMARDRIFEISWSSSQATALTGAYITIQDAAT